MKTYDLTLSANGNDYAVKVDATAHYDNVGIGRYEFWGEVGNDVRLEFVCEIDKVFLVSRSGKRRREIHPTRKQIEDLQEQIQDFDIGA